MHHDHHRSQLLINYLPLPPPLPYFLLKLPALRQLRGGVRPPLPLDGQLHRPTQLPRLLRLSLLQRGVRGPRLRRLRARPLAGIPRSLARAPLPNVVLVLGSDGGDFGAGAVDVARGGVSRGAAGLSRDAARPHADHLRVPPGHRASVESPPLDTAYLHERAKLYTAIIHPAPGAKVAGTQWRLQAIWRRVFSTSGWTVGRFIKFASK